MDISLTETEKLLGLSHIFGVTIDVLLKDELTVDGVKENELCYWTAITFSSNEGEFIL